jgi:hypothetical protein
VWLCCYLEERDKNLTLASTSLAFLFRPVSQIRLGKSISCSQNGNSEGYEPLVCNTLCLRGSLTVSEEYFASIFKVEKSHSHEDSLRNTWHYFCFVKFNLIVENIKDRLCGLVI